MATTKAHHDELQKLSTNIVDKFLSLEDSFKKMLDESLKEMREVGSHNRDGASSASRGPRQTDKSPPSVQRNDHTTPFGPTQASPIRHHVKLDFPRFSSGDPTEWLSKAKQYFVYQEIPRAQQVCFASYHLTEEANEWWQAISKALGIDPNTAIWDTFEEEWWVRFGPTEGENFHEALSKIRQTGPLRSYQREFKRLMNKVNNWSEEALVGTFLGGLNDSIGGHIRMFSRKTLWEVINLASLRDEQLQKQKSIVHARNYPLNPTTMHINTNHDISSPTPKKLSWEEMKRKRSLGLCFSCDERYILGHKCRTSQLLLMQGEDASAEEAEIFHDTDEPNITLQALTGWEMPGTLRVETMINQQQLIALIDSGSTHNFIRERAANWLNLKLTPVNPFTVRVADGYPLKYRGSYQQVSMKLGGVNFSLELFVLPLTGLDLVLGIDWLAKLGPTLCDWEAHTMAITWAEKR